MIHPDDAGPLGIEHGAAATVRSSSGAVTLPAEVTEDMIPGTARSPTAGATICPAWRCAWPKPTPESAPMP